jgi:sortase A
VNPLGEPRQSSTFVGSQSPGYHAVMALDDDNREPSAAAREDGGGSPPRPAPGKSRWVRRLADVLLIAGGLVLAYPFWSAGYAQIQQGRLDSAYQQASSSFSATAASSVARSRRLPKDVVIRRLATLYRSRVKTGDPVARLRIPRIHLDRVVQQGVSGRKSLDPNGDRALLRNGPVHYGITPLPGQGMPFAVAGHRTTYGAPFYRLDKLRRGDPIYVETPYAKFTYAVAKVTVVLPTNIDVLSDRGYGLVLTTCTPLYSASHRLIVWASLKKETPVKKASPSTP